tara:strand:+ start:2573 stop:2785 length:213 start_codon:yes stop_codon:yes gene_type:complete
MLTADAIHELALDKTRAKRVMLEIRANRLKYEIDNELNVEITLEQLIAVYEGTLKEQKVWEYMEKNLKYK